ncbi:MAG TPA: hypothetical protein DCO72_00575 [Ruminococcus sp.]|nr:hypothetical protein [Ruminococcus sp.]
MDIVQNFHAVDYGRIGKMYCIPFQTEIEVLVTDEEVTEDYIEKCANALNHLSQELMDTICKGAKAYCLKFMEIVDDDFEEMSIPVDESTSFREMLKCFSVMELIVPEPEDETKIGYQLFCCCDWEIEHGMEIDILENKVVYLSAFNGFSPWMEYDEGEWNFVNGI